MSFKDELKHILESYTDDTQPTDQTFKLDNETERLEITNLIALAPHYNLICDGLIDDGVLEFSTKTKQSVEHFCDKLDDIENVYTYEINVIVKDPLTGGDTDQTDTLIFDDMIDSPYIKYIITVYLNPDIITYDPVYIDIDGDNVDSDDFEYDDDYMYVNENVNITKKIESLPFFINISKSKSKVVGGKITCSILKDKNLITVFLQYPTNTDFEKNREQILDDIDYINSGKFTPKFKKQFKLQKPAELNADNNNVLAAVYSSVNNVDIYSLVESLENVIDVVGYDILDEVKRKIKINFRGIKRIKMQCATGFKYDSNRKICVKITGSELTTNRIAHRKAARTKKAKGSGYRRRIIFKSKRANKFRKMLGVRNAN